MSVTRLLVIVFGMISVLFMSDLFPESSYRVIRLASGHQAIHYIPEGLQLDKPVPLIVALHGMNQGMHHSYRTWKPVADALGVMLLCPKGRDYQRGYIRRPVDERQIIVSFYDQLSDMYQIDTKRSLLAGFSRGGNFVLEMGILYPNRFSKIVSICGFFNRSMERYLTDIDRNKRRYNKSHFYLITGQSDLSHQSTYYVDRYFKSHAIQSTVYEYPTLIHNYPSNLMALTERLLESY